MAVNKKIYDISFSYDIAGLDNCVAKFRQALIDGGVMTEWFDAWDIVSSTKKGSFRVLKLVQDAGKTYGTSYIIFQFTVGYLYGGAMGWSDKQGVSVSFATGWNATSHVATGTQFLDYYDNCGGTIEWGMTTGSGYNLFNIGGSTRGVRLVTYTSGDTFMFRFDQCSANYFLLKNIDAQPSWVDLNKTALIPFFGIGGAAAQWSQKWRLLYFFWPFQIRRMVLSGRSAITSHYRYFSSGTIANAYYYLGYGGQNQASTDEDECEPSGPGAIWAGAIRLPWSDGANLPNSSTPWAPIVTGLDIATPLNLKLSSDFAFAMMPSKTRNAYGFAQLKVSDTELWESLGQAANNGEPNPMIVMARMV